MKTDEMKFNLCSALLGTGLVNPIDSGVEKSARKLTFWALCRQVPGGEKAWVAVVDKLLELDLEAQGFDLHVCRRYVRRSGRMAFGWYLSVAGPAKTIGEPLMGVIQLLVASKLRLEVPRPLWEQPAQAPILAPEPPPGAPDPGSLQPRPPGPPARVGAAPPGYNPNPRVTLRTIDPDTGKSHVEMEMPLPFVYGEMNKPTPGGRGARAYTGGGKGPGGR
jgi:hypothetical protein